MNIGVISDTHGYFDPQITGLFAGVEHILHTGDIGQSRVIWELEKIAPVTAVLGNVDGGLPFKETEVVELGGRTFLIHHIVNVHAPAEPLERRIAQANPEVVVFGHTHKPFCQTIGRVLYFNPGYAGKARFNLPRSVAILHCGETGIEPEFLPV